MNQLLMCLGMALAKPVLGFVLRRLGGNPAPGRTGSVPLFEQVHRIPGRIRYRSEVLKDPEFAAELAGKFRTVPGVFRAESNPVTGSLLITYAEDRVNICRVFDELNANLLTASQSPTSAGDLIGEILSGGVHSASPSGTAGPASRAVPALCGTSFRDHFLESLALLSSRISDHTKGFFDLPSLLGVVLISRGIYKMVTMKQMPSGPQMVWWGLCFLKIRGKNAKALSFSPAASGRH
ncbi:HMA2 domain-containing protein [Succinimonas amylolytica]|uniref:HMA2 domain-containing protein n=1 Tax=Succinimonas amylolytica TaxID=83769 RepID=UPI000379E3CE|nr:hypothetical protein [Succinimonas amylolytica]